MLDLVLFTEFFDGLSVAVSEMNVDDDCGILSIIFATHSFFDLDIEHLPVQKVNLFDIIDPTVLIAKLIEIRFNFDFGGRNFVFAIGLVHFGYDFGLLFNGGDGSVAASAPGLGTNELKEGIAAMQTFLLVVGGDVDRVHLLLILDGL